MGVWTQTQPSEVLGGCGSVGGGGGVDGSVITPDVCDDPLGGAVILWAWLHIHVCLPAPTTQQMMITYFHPPAFIHCLFFSCVLCECVCVCVCMSVCASVSPFETHFQKCTVHNAAPCSRGRLVCVRASVRVYVCACVVRA